MMDLGKNWKSEQRRSGILSNTGASEPASIRSRTLKIQTDSIAASSKLAADIQKISSGGIAASSKLAADIHKISSGGITAFNKLAADIHKISSGGIAASNKLAADIHKISSGGIAASNKLAADIFKISSDGLRKLTAIDVGSELLELDGILASLRVPSSDIEKVSLDRTQALEVEAFFASNALLESEDYADWITRVISSVKVVVSENQLSDKTKAFILDLVIQIAVGLFCGYLFQSPQANININNNYYQTNYIINQQCPELIDTGFKIVNRHSCVRSKNDRKSRAISVLVEGELVEILESCKHWRFVRLIDGDSSVEGWVKAKYLRSPKPLSKHFRRKE